MKRDYEAIASKKHNLLPYPLPSSPKATILKKFADDTKWGAVVETAQDRACFQEGIDKLQEWAQKWQMAFNSDKCHILHMGEHNQKFKYQLEGGGPSDC